MTKEMLDEATREWLVWRKGLDAPKPATKALPPAVALSRREAALINGVAPIIHDLENRIAALAARVAELERSQKTYLGVWKEGKEYTAQSEVTCDGARWICHKRTSDKPSTSADWTMMEKSAPAAHPRPDAAAASPRSNGQHPNPRMR